MLAKPPTAAEAAQRLRFFRDQLGCRHCGYNRGCWVEAIAGLSEPSFAARQTFDLVLAVTLRRNGVSTLYTRNVSDFVGFGWFEVINPLS